MKQPIPGYAYAFTAQSLLKNAVEQLAALVEAHEQGTKDHRLVQLALSDVRQGLKRLNRRIENG